MKRLHRQQEVHAGRGLKMRSGTDNLGHRVHGGFGYRQRYPGYLLSIEVLVTEVTKV